MLVLNYPAPSSPVGNVSPLTTTGTNNPDPERWMCITSAPNVPTTPAQPNTAAYHASLLIAGAYVSPPGLPDPGTHQTQLLSDKDTQTPSIVTPNCVQRLAKNNGRDESGWFLSKDCNLDGSRVIHHNTCGSMPNPSTHIWARPCRNCLKPDLLTGSSKDMRDR